MRFNLKNFLKCLGYSKAALVLLLTQSVIFSEAHAAPIHRSVYIAFGPTSFSTGGMHSIGFTLLNKTQDTRVYPYYPVHNVVVKLTLASPIKNNNILTGARPLGGIKSVSGQTCTVENSATIICTSPGILAGGVANISFNYELDHDTYANDEFVRLFGQVYVKVEISYIISDAAGTRSSSAFIPFLPINLVKPPVTAPPIVDVPPPTPVEVAPPATPVEVVPPPAAPIIPPITPDPNSGKSCGTVVSNEACACLGCQDEDFFETKAELDKMFKLAVTEANNAVAKFKKYESGKRNSVVVRSSNRRIKNLLEEFAELLKEIGDSNFTCDSNQYCLDVSNDEILSDFEYIMDEMKNVSIAIARKLRKLPNSAKDVREIRLLALSNYAEGLEALEDLPAVTSVCSQTDAAVVCGGDA